MRYEIPKLIEKLNKSNIDLWRIRIRTQYEVGINEYFEDRDPGDKSQFARVSIVYCDENLDDKETIGYINYRVFNIFDRVTGETYYFHDLIDSVDQDTYNVLCYFLGDDGNLDEKYFVNAFYHIEKIEIYEKYQNMGLGTLAMQYLLSEYSNIGVLFILKPFAFQKKDCEDLDTYNEKLKSFYTRLGFEKLTEDVWYYGEY